jgi:hypothetical protein
MKQSEIGIAHGKSNAKTAQLTADNALVSRNQHTEWAETRPWHRGGMGVTAG